MGLIRLVPLWAWAALVLLAWGGINKHRAAVATRAAAEAREQAASAQEAARRLDTLQEVTDAATIRLQARPAALRAAAAAGDGLRLRAAELAASAAAPAADCTPAADASRVLADVLGRLEEAGRRAAAIADERGDAGAACERAWDAMSQPGR